MGEISGYPEYTSTLLDLDLRQERTGSRPMRRPPASRRSRARSRRARPPSRRRRSPTANALGMLKTRADERRGHHDLRPPGQVPGPDALRLARSAASGSTAWSGCEDVYGLQFKSFNPVDIGLRYTVLDKGQADLSILFTSDAQLAANPDKYVLLQDDKGIFPPGTSSGSPTSRRCRRPGPTTRRRSRRSSGA